MELLTFIVPKIYDSVAWISGFLSGFCFFLVILLLFMVKWPTEEERYEQMQFLNTEIENKIRRNKTFQTKSECELNNTFTPYKPINHNTYRDPEALHEELFGREGSSEIDAIPPSQPQTQRPPSPSPPPYHTMTSQAQSPPSTSTSDPQKPGHRKLPPPT